MNHWRRCQFTFTVVFILLSKSSARTQNDNVRDETDRLPPEFVQFINGLDKMVFKSEHTDNSTSPPKLPKKRTITRHAFYRRRNDFKTTQKDALQDMLMLKLVSYYEDKYKVESGTHTTARTFGSIGSTTVKSSNYEDTNLPSDDNGKFTQSSSPDVRYSRLAQDYNTLDQNTPDATQDIAEVVVL